jgi:hypothetical protein
MPQFAANDRRAVYDLVCFDSGGNERADDPSGRMSVNDADPSRVTSTLGGPRWSVPAA